MYDAGKEEVRPSQHIGLDWINIFDNPVCETILKTGQQLVKLRARLRWLLL